MSNPSPCLFNQPPWSRYALKSLLLIDSSSYFSFPAKISFSIVFFTHSFKGIYHRNIWFPPIMELNSFPSYQKNYFTTDKIKPSILVNLNIFTCIIICIFLLYLYSVFSRMPKLDGKYLINIMENNFEIPVITLLQKSFTTGVEHKNKWFSKNEKVCHIMESFHMYCKHKDYILFWLLNEALQEYARHLKKCLGKVIIRTFNSLIIVTPACSVILLTLLPSVHILTLSILCLLLIIHFYHIMLFPCSSIFLFLRTH